MASTKMLFIWISRARAIACEAPEGNFSDASLFVLFLWAHDKTTTLYTDEDDYPAVKFPAI